MLLAFDQIFNNTYGYSIAGGLVDAAVNLIAAAQNRPQDGFWTLWTYYDHSCMF